jgi:hypothetical protein
MHIDIDIPGGVFDDCFAEGELTARAGIAPAEKSLAKSRMNLPA